MQNIIKILIAVFVVCLGVPIGNFLAKKTKEELKDSQKGFKILLVSIFVGALIGLILRNDILLFSFLFIGVVTSRSLIKKIKKIKLN